VRQSNKMKRLPIIGAFIVSLLLLFTTSAVAVGSSSSLNFRGASVSRMVSLVSSKVSTTTFQDPFTTDHHNQPQRHHVSAKRHRAHKSIYEQLRKRIPAWFRAALNRLGQCENSGQYDTVANNGFYGRYQFDLGTWRSLGYYNDPATASPAQQDWAAYRLYRQRGTQPWPHCGYLLLT
jgi:hypothetical protein